MCHVIIHHSTLVLKIGFTISDGGSNSNSTSTVGRRLVLTILFHAEAEMK
jgi:hypothetical protein